MAPRDLVLYIFKYKYCLCYGLAGYYLPRYVHPYWQAIFYIFQSKIQAIKAPNVNPATLRLLFLPHFQPCTFQTQPTLMQVTSLEAVRLHTLEPQTCFSYAVGQNL